MINFLKKLFLLYIFVISFSFSYGANESSYFNKGDKSLSKYLIGVMYSSSGNCADAIPYFEEALEFHKDPAIFIELAQCYLYSNGIERALELLEESIKLFPDYTKSYQLAGDIYYQNYISGIASDEVLKKAVNYLEKGCDNGKYSEFCIKAVDISVYLKNLGTAISIFETLDLNEIKDPRFLAFAASMYQNTENVNQIKRIIKTISRLKIDDIKLLDLLTNLSISSGMYNEAKIFMDKIVDIDSNDFKLWDKYMFVLLETDDFPNVKKIFKDKYEKNPSILSLYTLANCFSKEHKYDESIKYYQKIFLEDKGSWDKNIIRDIYSDYLKILLITKNYKKAFGEVEKYRLENPEDKSMLLDCFNVYVFNDNKKKAMEIIKELNELLKNKDTASNLKEMYLNRPEFLKERYLGNVYFSLQDFKQAGFYLEKAFNKDNGAKEIGIPLASIYEKSNLIDKVIEVYSKLLKKNQDSPEVLNNYSYFLLIYNKKLDYALELAKKAVSLSPENPVYRDTLGYAFLLTNDLLNGEKHLKFAYSKIADNSEVCDHLGDLYYKKLDYKSAIKFWQESIINGVTNAEKVNEKITSAEDLL